jgi:alpha-beta hydrolase superfamily lysophospholipase
MVIVFDLVIAVLALTGFAAVALLSMLARPLKNPPALRSVVDGALEIDGEGLPELTPFQARDGTWLAYRLYPAVGVENERVAIVVHGSSGSSGQMNGVARAIAAAGFSALALDLRGHGASGTRGDVAYLGQLDDDLADLIEVWRRRHPAARLVFVGHSAGGGYGLRVASSPLGAAFERFVLLAPYLGWRAPTNRPSEGAGRWAATDIPRIVAIRLLARLGVAWPQALPTLAFAVGEGARKFVTDRYTYRLMASFAAPEDWAAAFRRAKAPIVLIAGTADELMDAAAYPRVLGPLGVAVTLLPDIDHMGLCWRPEALQAVAAALSA